MRCYECDSVLSDADFCTSCGSDVKIYKKIIKLSNAYYNMGLAKAKVRDLSGAADLLKRSVKINKNNTNARNLLGLVYFETGECVKALGEWVISKNLQPEKNLADKYLKEIQQSPSKLELINHAARKFNTALKYALDGSDDLAIVQLKRLFNSMPNYLKCGQFLALLYIKNKEYEKAAKVLKKVLKVDVNNTLANIYMKEVSDALESQDYKKEVSAIDEETEREELSGNDVIIPKTTYREGNSVATGIINILIGIVLGAAATYFLITPARENAVKQEYNGTIKEYSAKIANHNSKVNDLENTIAELESSNALLKSELDSKTDEVGKSAVYDELLQAAAYFAAQDYVQCAEIVSAMNADVISTAGFKSAYSALKEASYPQAAESYFKLGTDRSRASDFNSSVEYFRKAYAYNPDDVKIVYNLARDLRSQNGFTLNEESTELFEKVISMSPSSAYAGYAHNYLGY